MNKKTTLPLKCKVTLNILFIKQSIRNLIKLLKYRKGNNNTNTTNNYINKKLIKIHLSGIYLMQIVFEISSDESYFAYYQSV